MLRTIYFNQSHENKTNILYVLFTTFIFLLIRCVFILYTLLSQLEFFDSDIEQSVYQLVQGPELLLPRDLVACFLWTVRKHIINLHHLLENIS